MVRHYLKLAFRNLFKNKIYSFINLGGLAVGLAACLAIGLYIRDEYSYDRFHRHFDHLYRIVETQRQADGFHPVAVTPGPLAASLEKDFAEIVHTTRVGRWPSLLQVNGTSIEPASTLIVENTFFKMFDFQLVLGDPETVFTNPDELIITETLATQFFGPHWRDSAVLGKNMRLNAQTPLLIVGVVADPPANSHLAFEALLPFKYLEKYDEWSNKWNSNNYHTYVQLEPETNVAAFNQKIAPQLARYDQNNAATLQLQPLRDIYLYSKFDFETDWGPRSDIFYVRIFLAVGLMVLLIAMVNFVNLSTARAAQRAREVGVRKAVGAQRKSLIFQFLGESLLMAVAAVAVALMITQSTLALFTDLTDKQLTLPVQDADFWLLIAGATALIGLLTGAYPAFFLSAFRPAKVLKGVFDVRSGLTFRKTLVVGQFVLSIALGISTVVIYQQLNFIQHKKLGFDQSQLLYLRLKGPSRAKSAIFKDELRKLPGVASVTATTSNLINAVNSTTITWEGQTPQDQLAITQMNVDADFIATTGMRLAAGRNFSASITSDTLEKFGHYLLNETAAQRMGYTNTTVLGKKVTFWGLEGEVIGVLKDFNFRPLSKTIEPFILRFRPKDFYFHLLIKTEPGNTPETIAAIENVYKKLDPDNPVKYGFVDQDLEAQYRAEERTGRTILYFSMLAVLISCLGLFGLAALTAEQRTKEIGIRKVLGASVAVITGLLTKDFLKLVVVTLLIASPIAYWGMQQWLANFAYRIDIQWWMFAGAGLVAVLTALLTVGAQSIKAALANPVQSLRSE